MNSCCHFKKKTSTYQRGCRENSTGMCQFLLFLHTMSHFLMRFLKNRIGILSTFYHGYIYRSCATALVSLIQPLLNIYFLLVPNSKGG